MASSDGQFEAPPGPGLSKEELEEMLWFYRTEDSTPWNLAVLILSLVISVLNVFLLWRNIMANRNQEMNSQDKPAVETTSSSETITNQKDSVSKDDTSFHILKEKLLFQNQNPEEEMNELKERAVQSFHQSHKELESSEIMES